MCASSFAHVCVICVCCGVLACTHSLRLCVCVVCMYTLASLVCVCCLNVHTRSARVCSMSKFPKVYFDLKAFRNQLGKKKSWLESAEKRSIDKLFAREPPNGWTVATFLQKTKLFSSSPPAELSSLSWKEFISSSEFFRFGGLDRNLSKKLIHYIELFNHGLWPEAATVEPAKIPAEWTPIEIEKLKSLAQSYDPHFGNPWMYISHALGRTEDDVLSKYFSLQENRETKPFEICISKSFRPLLMNRQFRLIPPQLVVVPHDIVPADPPNLGVFAKYL